MVAEMASCGAGCHLDDGDGEVPTAEHKGNLAEGDNSGSENTGTSTEDSSEEEEEEDDEDEDEEDSAEGRAEKDTAAGEPTEPGVKGPNNETGPEAEDPSVKDETRLKLCCEKCKAIQQTHGNERVNPRRISKGRLQVLLEAEGTYECQVTGLVFEVSERVLVRYSVLSWSKFGAFLRGSWKFAGPIFNVDCVNKDSTVLKSIQFPHSLCLADPKNETTFSVLHIKDNRPVIEPTVEHSGSHVKWRVSSLSPVGPVVQADQPVEHHGVVLVYKELGNDNNSCSFRIYLATNNSSDIKDIGKEVRSSKRRYMKIEKPPTCKLDERRYHLTSEPEGEINPEDLPFTLAVTKLKGYFEAFFEQPPPFKLSLLETESDQSVWSATIREGDCVDNSAEKPKKRPEAGRKRNISASEEEPTNKRPRRQDESEGTTEAPPPGQQDVTEKQLLQVAKRLGKEWKQVAIFLDLSSRDLEDIQAAEQDGTMQKLRMLVEWKSRRRPGEASASQLWRSLEDLDDLPNEVHQTLKDMMDNRLAK